MSVENEDTGIDDNLPIATDAEAAEGTEDNKRPRKVSKTWDGTLLTITVIETGESVIIDVGPMMADSDLLLTMVKAAVGRKVDCALGGKDATDSFTAVTKLNEGFEAKNWNVRVPAAAKISVKDLKLGLEKMEPGQRAAAIEVLKSMNIDPILLGIKE